MRNHPFLDAAFLPAWSTLQAERIVPDITLAVERAEAAIAAIAGSELNHYFSIVGMAFITSISF